MPNFSRRSVLASALRITVGAVAARAIGIVPELRAAFAAEPPTGVQVTALSQQELNPLLERARQHQDIQTLHRFLIQQGYTPHAGLVAGVRASDKTSSLQGVVIGYDGHDGATLAYVEGTGFATGLALLVNEAAYIVHDGKVVESAEATRRLKNLRRQPEQPSQGATTQQIECPTCCTLIVLCAAAGAACLAGCVPCCGPGLGICAGAAGACAACPCHF